MYSRFKIILLFCFLSASISYADNLHSKLNSLDELASKVQKYTLPNGLRILYLERAIVPVFVGQVWVRVGSSDELPGRTGSAHLLEHMAFKGTKAIGTSDYKKEKPLLEKYYKLFEKHRETKDDSLLPDLKDLEGKLAEIWDSGGFTSLYQKHGAVGLNAGTSTDYTMYTAALPSSELEFWFSMESDRIKHPVFRQFYKELDVVKEERRMRFDDVPSGKLMEAILASAYWGHPYHNLVIGWKSDLDRLTVKDATYMHSTYYRPDNMVVVLVGDLRGQDILELSKRYFGRIENPKEPLISEAVAPVAQNSERIVKVEYASEPMMFMGFHIPTSPHPDALAFSLLHSILADGEASVLERELKHKRKLVSSVFTTELPGELYDPIFIIGATPAKGKSYSEVEAAIYEVLATVKKNGVSDEVFNAAKTKTKYAYLQALSSNQGLADMLGSKELLRGDWKVIKEEYEIIQNTTPEQVWNLIDKYIYKNNQTTVEIKNSRSK